MRRQFQLFSVTGLAANRPWFATGADFETAYLGTCEPDMELVVRSAPYAFRFGAERVLSVVYESRQELVDSTFFYQHQQKSGRTLVSIPYERLHEVPWEVTPEIAAPGLLFSMGRSGSTLLSKLMGALGTPSLSEPDIFTQYALSLPDPAVVPGFDDTHEVFGFVMAGLLNAAGSPSGGLKFRSQTNLIAHQLMKALPRAGGLMLVRDIEPWASSLCRTFSYSPEAVADTLAGAHSAVHACAALGRPLTIVRYEDLCERPVEVLGRIGDALGVESQQIDEAQVHEVMSKDSQADSPWGREGKEGVELPGDFLSQFHQQWGLRKAHLQSQGVDFLF